LLPIGWFPRQPAADSLHRGAACGGGNVDLKDDSELLERIRARQLEIQQLYELTKNPILVWQQIRTCRDCGLDFPVWILDYLEKVATAIDVASLGFDRWSSDDQVLNPLPEGEQVKRRLLEAFGFWTHAHGRGGPQNHFVSADDIIWEEDVATRVRVLVDGDRQAESNAFYIVAHPDGHPHPVGLSESKVRRIWEKYQDCVRSRDLERQRQHIRELDRLRHSRSETKQTLPQTPGVSGKRLS
jgi:hypothetical protein